MEFVTSSSLKFVLRASVKIYAAKLRAKFKGKTFPSKLASKSISKFVAEF